MDFVRKLYSEFYYVTKFRLLYRLYYDFIMQQTFARKINSDLIL